MTIDEQARALYPIISGSASPWDHPELYREPERLIKEFTDMTRKVVDALARATRLNLATQEGRELGAELARLCDVEAGRQQLKRERCGTYAFRHGDHLANGSPETLMDALKCVMERTIFWCHEADRPCVGWRLLVSPVNVPMSWPITGGVD